MDEETFHAGMVMVQHRLPPCVERHLDHLAAQPLDRSNLGVGCPFRDDDPAADAHLASTPGHALGHVPCTRGVHAVRQRLAPRECHRVGGTTEFEGADRLEVLELEEDLWRGIRQTKAHQRRPEGDAVESSARGFDGGERDGRQGVTHAGILAIRPWSPRANNGPMVAMLIESIKDRAAYSAFSHRCR